MFTKELSIFNEALNNFKKNQLSKGNSSAIEVFEDVFKDINKIHKVENNYISTFQTYPQTIYFM